MKQRAFWLITIPLLALLGAAAWLHGLSGGADSVSGVVTGVDGPLAGARLRVRATENLVLSDAEGRFTLAGVTAGEAIEVTAWYTGYYIAGVHVTPPTGPVALQLRPHHNEDHPDYHWTSPLTGTSDHACGICHPMILSRWRENAHGQAIHNPRFYSLYDGTDVGGTTVISPGYRLDFPGTAGNCASCHAPGAAVDGYLTTNMDGVRDVVTAGIHCDFCHKVGGAYLDPAGGSVYPNAPGVESLRLLRPPAGDDIFLGPYDDIPDPDTYLPLMAESQFCAACHQFSFWGTPIYESYDEWLASSFAAAGVTCQDCHMPPSGDAYFALPEVGGLPHPPEQIPAHFQLGASSTLLLRETISITVEARQVAEQIWVTVSLTNFGAGHHVPTDHPGRHLILTVAASGSGSSPLPLLDGPRVPAWGGAEAGLPGEAYAKVLADVTSGEAPVVSYWKPTWIVADNRIPAGETVASRYIFEAPPAGTAVSVTAALRFRRLFQAEADARGWETPDILMEEDAVSLTAAPWVRRFLPLVPQR